MTSPEFWSLLLPTLPFVLDQLGVLIQPGQTHSDTQRKRGPLKFDSLTSIFLPERVQNLRWF